jgi:hypothetical protein
MSQLPNADRIEALLAEGKEEEARATQAAFEDDWMKRASRGEVMNLSDLMASKESLHVQNCKPLYAKLAAIRLENIPVMSRDRHIPRKEQAALARQLFKRLGLRGISVTTPRYSMAHSVDVRLPAEGQHDPDKWPHSHRDWCGPNGTGHDEATRCPACRDRAAAEKKLEALLLAAFPCHDDRSDSQTDYFDFRWTVE